MPTGFQFVNEVTGGNIPKEFISPVEKGFKSGLSSGIQAGYLNRKCTSKHVYI